MLRIDLGHPDAPVIFHNVAEFERSRRGLALLRVPQVWRERFPEATGFRATQAAGVEIRFRSNTRHVEIELTAINHINYRAVMALYHGYRAVGLASLPQQFSGRVVLFDQEEAIDAEVEGDWRILLPYGARSVVKALYLSDGAELQAAAPRPVRWLAHGDSITQGARALSPGMTYVCRVADLLGWEALNLGFGGSAWGDAPVAQYIASREDWDVLSLAIGTNTYAASTESAADYADTYDRFLEIVRKLRPDKPILCITPVWRSQDLEGGTPNQCGSTPQDYRDAIGEVVSRRQAADANLHLLDGLSLIGNSRGLVLDRVHPDDHGMQMMAEGMAPALRRIRHGSGGQA